MTILQTPTFAKAVKKLDKNQKHALDEAIYKLADQPDTAEEKKGDLAGVRVYKFHMNNQLSLLAYTFDKNILTLTLLAVGSHENFYRNFK